MRHLSLLLLSILALGACEQAERKGCPSRDLAALGRDEAARAFPESLPTADCVLDATELQRYKEGREEGLKRYCVAQRGYQLAMDGKPINAEMCPAEAAAELQRGFAIGDNLRKHLRQRDQLLNEARDIERAGATLPKDSPERRKLEDEAAGKRFDARQKENEVEALRGIVALERWR